MLILLTYLATVESPFAFGTLFGTPTGAKGDFFMSKNYLLATPANWFFRRKVPDELRATLGRRELKVSLKTGSKQTALKRARVLAYKTDLIFETLRGSTMAGERIDIPGLTELIAESTVTMPGGASIHRKIEMSEEEFKAFIAANSANSEIASNLLQQVGNILHPVETPVVAAPVENVPTPATPAVTQLTLTENNKRFTFQTCQSTHNNI
jgi:hypothetical protein